MTRQKKRVVRNKNSAASFLKQLQIESARLRDTEYKMATTFGRQIEIAKRMAKVTTLKQALPIWHQYVASVHVLRHDVDRTISTLTRVEKALAGMGVASSSLSLPAELFIPLIESRLQAANLPSELVRRLISHLRQSNARLSFPGIRGRLPKQLDALDSHLHKRINRIGSLAEMKDEVKCAVPVSAPYDDIVSALFGPILVSAGGIVTFFGGPIEAAHTDEGPRHLFNTASCEQLRAIDPRELIIAIQQISRGPTLDGDEKAILRLFYCLSCDTVAEIWNSPSIRERGEGRISRRLLYDFDGEEWDRLVIRVHECGLVNFKTFDHSATRLFINSNACSVLSRLSNADVRRLLLNLFEDGTLDADERAIIKLIECLPLPRVAELLRMRDLSYDDFDDEVDGSEWRRLRRTLDLVRAMRL